MTIKNILALLVLSLLFTACTSGSGAASLSTPPVRAVIPAPLAELPAAQIARHPAPADYRGNDATAIPKYDPTSGDPWQIDLRSDNLAGLDLSNAKPDLLHADFDSQTIWPLEKSMPAGFDPQQIMELGKNPGLGIRALHGQGITGRGVGIAIIDQTLLVDHIEYKDRIRIYEEGEYLQGSPAESEMHGPAVASIAVGKTVGVAPGADLYYIASFCYDGKENDFACFASGIRRVVEINKELPASRRIRVLSMSIGWNERVKGYRELQAALKEAAATGILVINVDGSTDLGANIPILGLGRSPLADPELFSSYSPAVWWQESLYSGKLPPILLVPMDSRTTASPTGAKDYVFYSAGGMSWAVPYMAGMYALAAQVKPDITPETFWKLAFKTGRSTRIQHAGQSYTFGVILDPQALIVALQK